MIHLASFPELKLPDVLMRFSGAAPTPALHFSPVRAPHAECKFVLEFLHEDTDLHGATGYALATFQAAVEGCTQLEPEPEQRKNGPPQGVL